jgi:hypothetical protein
MLLRHTAHWLGSRAAWARTKPKARCQVDLKSAEVLTASIYFPDAASLTTHTLD